MKHVLEAVVHVAVDIQEIPVASSSVVYGSHAIGPRSPHHPSRCFLTLTSLSIRLKVLFIGLAWGWCQPMVHLSLLFFHDLLERLDRGWRRPIFHHNRIYSHSASQSYSGLRQQHEDVVVFFIVICIFFFFFF